MVQVRQEADELVLELQPAYVHHWVEVVGTWQGTGRTQAARLRLKEGRVTPTASPIAGKIADGWIRIDEDLYDNLLPAPLFRRGVVSGRLTVVGLEPVDLSGTALTIELVGPSQDVEELPADWAPVRRAV